MNKTISFSPPDISEAEIASVVETLHSGWITTGPKTKKFEKEVAEFCGTSRAVCLNSATAALELALHVLGIGPGDEVITSAYTYTASASPICHVGATPVLVDVAKDSYEMDYDQLKAAITPRTKAIVPVDLGGVLCDYDRIMQIAEETRASFTPSDNAIQKAIGRVMVVADCAHGIGAVRKGLRAGQIADFTSFSFHAVKNLTTGEGGAVTWKDFDGIDNEDIYRHFMLLSLHGQSKDALAKTQIGAWEYDIVAPNYKCNMTDIMASIGLEQLKRYPELIARRKELLEIYYNGLKDQPVQILQHDGEDFSSSRHLCLVRLLGKDAAYRNAFIIKMAEHGVATNVHYKPLPLLTAYKNLGFDIKDYPNAYAQYENEVTLPLHTLLTDEDAHYVVETMCKVLEEMK